MSAASCDEAVLAGCKTFDSLTNFTQDGRGASVVLPESKIIVLGIMESACQ